MRKAISFIATLALVLLATACGSKKGQSASDTASALTVDSLLANPEKYVNETVTVEGLCSHLCKSGGRKAFIRSNADSLVLRCEAFPGMNEPFSSESVDRRLRVTGVFHEERIDEAYLLELERTEQARVDNIKAQGGEEKNGAHKSGCDTERAAQGQQKLQTVAERVADYRARIAERDSTEGKPYLSFYFIEATGYEILPD